MAKKLEVYDKDYSVWVQELKERYLRQRLRAHSAVMNYCLEFYWSVGKDIVSKQSENKYGSGFYKRLSLDLQNELPGVKGLSPTNLKYMKYFYELYADTPNRQQFADDFKENALLLPSILWKVLLYQLESLSMSFQNFIRLILRAACQQLKKLRNF